MKRYRVSIYDHMSQSHKPAVKVRQELRPEQRLPVPDVLASADDGVVAPDDGEVVAPPDSVSCEVSGEIIDIEWWSPNDSLGLSLSPVCLALFSRSLSRVLAVAI